MNRNNIHLDASNESYAYYNGTLTNQNTDKLPIDAYYLDVATTPYINKKEDFQLTLVRFKIPAPATMFNFDTETLSLKFTYSGNTYSQNLVYVA